MILTNSNFSYDEMKKIIFEILSKNTINQYSDITNEVAKYLLDKEVCIETSISPIGTERLSLSKSDGMLVNQIVWDLIFEKIIIIGSNKKNAEWPYLRVTSLGKNIVCKENPIDNFDSMISNLKTNVPDIDSVVLSYFELCLMTYNIAEYLSSTVMLGCAAEKAILLMIEKYQKWLSDNGYIEESEKFQNIDALTISGKFSEFNKSINAKRDLFPNQISDELVSLVQSIFTEIRNNIKEPERPEPKEINPDELTVWINFFPNHCENIYKIIDYFE